MDEGYPVKKGEKASMVFFFKFIETADIDTGEIQTIPLLKYYSVFHISQCEGMQPRFASSAQPQSDLNPDLKAESIINSYVQRSGVLPKREHSSKAFYSPSLDMIVVPEISQYTELSVYYSTAFHEIVHSTGHPSRLNRINDVAQYGSESYSKEELVAELGASFLVNVAGLETKNQFDNSAAYIQGWLYALKNDKRFVVSAAGKAEQAVKLILNELTLDIATDN